MYYVSNYYINIVKINYSDIDECAEGTAHCEQTCINTNGSFECTCVDGYTLNKGDNKTCSISE